MITSIQGVLERVEDHAVHVRLPLGEHGVGLTYEVLVPACASRDLHMRTGQPITLHTLQYLESHNQGASFTPRLVGFVEVSDRRFFELFTTCKGIGYRKALRAMAIPPSHMAAAIADRDVKLLQTLPEIGKRTAETIIVTLKDKIDAFLQDHVSSAPRGGAAVATPGATVSMPGGKLAREAVEVLVQLGEQRGDAMRWVEQALAEDDHATEADALVARVYALRAGR